MENKKLKVIVITQNDTFYIPTNILKAAKVCNIVEVVDNKAKHSLDNKLSDMLKWFGFWQCAKMGVRTIGRKVQGYLDVISGLRLYGGKCGINYAAKKIGADFRVVSNLNDKSYVQHVRDIAPDLIISYSAPQIIKPELLSVPKHGIINVHGALLPDYRGCMPSFWYLFNDEKLGGATVHYMSQDIDDGDICLQGSVDISDCKTMFQLMKKTKELGGELIVESIRQIANGTLQTRPNDTQNGSYFSWPTVEQAKEFRKKGKRLN